MKTSSFFLAVAAGSIAAALFVVGGPPTRLTAAAATPPPTPPPMGAPVTPSPDASLAPPPGPAATLGPSAAPPLTHKAPPAPPRDARKGLDGVWEVQIQRPNTTDYTHFKLTQEGDTLTGTYLDTRGKRYPLAGSVDGQAIRLIVTMPNGTTMLLEGRLDGTTDMVGELTMSDGQLPFTASYRAKEKWIENVNPSPGGIPSGGGSYTPP